ncbi:hypothetical protein P2318_20140 [Myxococcaceae bacterium GXIMD 01537]
MAQITVTIGPKDITYDPSPRIRQGDTVVFSVAGKTGAIKVTFAEPSCFENTRTLLVTRMDLKTNPPMEVANNATRGVYSFSTDTLLDGVDSGIEQDSMKGDLEVVTDPPPLPEPKRG